LFKELIKSVFFLQKPQLQIRINYNKQIENLLLIASNLEIFKKILVNYTTE
jgi:hypothetical protein